MNEGRVEWFNETRGYGFILANGRLWEPLLAHYSCIVGDGFKSLSKDQKVYFARDVGRNGPRAINIYSEDNYAKRTALFQIEGDLQLEIILRDPRFLGEMGILYRMLPHKAAPTREWLLTEIRNFDKRRIAKRLIREEDLTFVYNFVLELELDFIRERIEMEQSLIALTRAETSTSDALRLNNQARSMHPIWNKEKAVEVFRRICIEADKTLSATDFEK